MEGYFIQVVLRPGDWFLSQNRVLFVHVSQRKHLFCLAVIDEHQQILTLFSLFQTPNRPFPIWFFVCFFFFHSPLNTNFFKKFIIFMILFLIFPRAGLIKSKEAALTNCYIKIQGISKQGREDL